MEAEEYTYRMDFTVPSGEWESVKTAILGFTFPSRTPLLLKNTELTTPDLVYAAFCTDLSEDFQPLFGMLSNRGVLVHQVRESA